MQRSPHLPGGVGSLQARKTGLEVEAADMEEKVFQMMQKVRDMRGEYEWLRSSAMVGSADMN